jgi:hypothetical protein
MRPTCTMRFLIVTRSRRGPFFQHPCAAAARPAVCRVQGAGWRLTPNDPHRMVALLAVMRCVSLASAKLIDGHHAAADWDAFLAATRERRCNRAFHFNPLQSAVQIEIVDVPTWSLVESGAVNAVGVRTSEVARGG